MVGGAVGDAFGDAVSWKCSRRDTNGDRGAVVVWAAVRRNCEAWSWWLVGVNVVGGAVGNTVGDAVRWKCSRRDTNGDRVVIVVWSVVRRNCAAWFWWFVGANVVGGAVGDAIGDAVSWKCSWRDTNGDRGVVMVWAVVRRNCAS